MAGPAGWVGCPQLLPLGRVEDRPSVTSRAALLTIVIELRPRDRIGQVGPDRLTPGPVDLPQGRPPPKAPRLRLGQRPTTVVLHGVVTEAERVQVLPDRVTTAGVVARVVLIGLACGASTSRGYAMSIAHLHMPAQAGAREPRPWLAVQLPQRGPTIGELAGQVGDQRSPTGRRVGATSQVGEQPGSNMDLHNATPTPASRPVPGRPGGAMSGQSAEQQVSVVVDDHEAPFRRVLALDQQRGHIGVDGAPPGQLGGMIVEAEQGGQPDPDLDPGAHAFRPSFDGRGGTGTDSHALGLRTMYRDPCGNGRRLGFRGGVVGCPSIRRSSIRHPSGRRLDILRFGIGRAGMSHFCAGGGSVGRFGLRASISPACSATHTMGSLFSSWMANPYSTSVRRRVKVNAAPIWEVLQCRDSRSRHSEAGAVGSSAGSRRPISTMAA